MARQSSTTVAWIIRGSIVLLAIAVGVIMTQLPVRDLIRPLRDALSGFGVAGMLIFVAVYVAATLLLLPGSVLSVAAGLAFGLLRGMATVIAATLVSASLAFLIARYAARKRVAKIVARHPRFQAVDRALGKGGWKIVALIRLSPVIPFGLQNYAYGMTPIGFWPCMLASALAMLPGTFLFVYIGYLARAGVTMDVENGVRVGVWALRIAGLIATAAVTVYVTRLARRALKEQAVLDED